MEDASTYLTAREAVRELVDVVSRGGNLLLNVGPDEAGRIPELQRRCLEGMAQWMEVGSEAVHASRPAEGTVACGDATPSAAAGGPDGEHLPWVRWVAKDAALYALVDADGEAALPATERVRTAVGDGAVLLDGGGATTPVGTTLVDGHVRAELPALTRPGPHALRLG